MFDRASTVPFKNIFDNEKRNVTGRLIYIYFDHLLQYVSCNARTCKKWKRVIVILSMKINVPVLTTIATEHLKRCNGRVSMFDWLGSHLEFSLC